MPFYEHIPADHVGSGSGMNLKKNYPLIVKEGYNTII